MNGFIFGGFTTKTWEGQGCKQDEKAFVFSLKNRENKPEKMSVNPAKSNYAIVANGNFGPIFGQGHTFCIYNMANQSEASYSNTKYLTYLADGLKADDYLAGSKYFRVADVEVYEIRDF